MYRLRLVLLGALCGGAWGVAARIWMRLVSTDPAFTWSGTLFIIVVGTIPGLGMGVVLARRGRGRWIGIVTMLPFGVGQGLIMLPSVVLGGLALSRRRRRPVLAAVLGGLAVLCAAGLIGRVLLADLSLPRAVITFVLYLALLLWLSAMLAVSLGATSPAVDDRNGRSGFRSRREGLGAQRAPHVDTPRPIGPPVDQPAGEDEVGAHQVARPQEVGAHVLGE